MLDGLSQLLPKLLLDLYSVQYLTVLVTNLNQAIFERSNFGYLDDRGRARQTDLRAKRLACTCFPRNGAARLANAGSRVRFRFIPGSSHAGGRVVSTCPGWCQVLVPTSSWHLAVKWAFLASINNNFLLNLPSNLVAALLINNLCASKGGVAA